MFSFFVIFGVVGQLFVGVAVPNFYILFLYSFTEVNKVIIIVIIIIIVFVRTQTYKHIG